MPRVSVLIPSFNHERFIGAAIESVLAQTLGDLELVIVDDGSSDGSRACIERYTDKRIVRHFQENQGAHAALNQALALASPESELVAILNSDDIYDPRWLEVAARTLEERGAGFCSALLKLFGDAAEYQIEWQRNWYDEALDHYRRCGDLEASLLRANFITTTSNVVFRRSLLQPAGGGFRCLRYVHDLDFFLRLAAHTTFALVEEELVHYRLHAANTIGESKRDDRRIVFEFGWILADVLERLVAGGADPHEVQQRALSLVQSLPQPAVAGVALTLLAPRAIPHAGGSAAAPSALADLLAPGHELVKQLIEAELDSRRPLLEALRKAHEELLRAREIELKALNSALEVMDRDNRALDKAVRDLAAENTRVRHSRTFRLGLALTETRGLLSALRLPMRVARIALEKPQAVPKQAPDGSGAGQAG
jgi:glycosyltransferase involved in cell wall biosynthesis